MRKCRKQQGVAKIVFALASIFFSPFLFSCLLTMFISILPWKRYNIKTKKQTFLFSFSSPGQCMHGKLATEVPVAAEQNTQHVGHTHAWLALAMPEEEAPLLRLGATTRLGSPSLELGITAEFRTKWCVRACMHACTLAACSSDLSLSSGAHLIRWSSSGTRAVHASKGAGVLSAMVWPELCSNILLFWTVLVFLNDVRNVIW